LEFEERRTWQLELRLIECELRPDAALRLQAPPGLRMCGTGCLVGGGTVWIE
jgi:hypothetical protein